MAIYYVPGEAGWNDNGIFGSAAQLRLKLETSYDAALNRSSLTVTLQGRLPNGSGDYILLDNARVSCNGQALFAPGGQGQLSAGCYICYGGTENWYSLADAVTGDPVSWSTTVQHETGGAASVTLGLHARLYQDSSRYVTCYNKSAAQDIGALRQYTLTIAAGSGSTVSVMRNGTALPSGAVLTHGEVLTVSFAAQSGYELTAHTVNGAAFPSGGSHTVQGHVTAAATARRLGLLRLDTGSAVQRFRVLLDTGSAIVPVRLFLDRGDRITEAGQ